MRYEGGRTYVDVVDVGSSRLATVPKQLIGKVGKTRKNSDSLNVDMDTQGTTL